jgi:hypothetical protein
MSESKRNMLRQAATNPRPGDFPVGSTQSRAAARLRLQEGAVGVSPNECICFPTKEQPDFRTNEDQERAVKIQCPLHGKRFEPRYDFFIAAWEWKREVKLRWPILSQQYHRAFRASFSEAELQALLEQAMVEGERKPEMRSSTCCPEGIATAEASPAECDRCSRTHSLKTTISSPA